MDSNTLIALLSLLLSIVSLAVSAMVSLRLHGATLYISQCFLSHADDVFDEWFVCVENAGPGTVRRLTCTLQSGSCVRVHPVLEAGADIVLTVRVPKGEDTTFDITWREDLKPWTIGVTGLRLDELERSKAPHHRADFLDDDKTVAKLITRSVNEPRQNGPTLLKGRRLHGSGC